jgi:hypothetical protein
MGAWSRASKITAWVVLTVSFSTALAQSGQNIGTPESKPDAAPPIVDDALPQMVETAVAELPDSPGMIRSGLQDTAQQSQSSTAPQTTSSARAQDSPPATVQDAKPQRPVGTAAAEAPVVSGVSAAQPSGVAIAPAKQHRARTIVIRVAALAGAGVAIGSVAALTAGTSSKPPGAH